MRSVSLKTTSTRSGKRGASFLTYDQCGHPDFPEDPVARRVRFTRTHFIVGLEDGREIGVPLKGCPLLRKASARALRDVEIIADGHDLHWPKLDEDIHVVDLLYPPRLAREFK